MHVDCDIEILRSELFKYSHCVANSVAFRGASVKHAVRLLNWFMACGHITSDANVAPPFGSQRRSSTSQRAVRLRLSLASRECAAHETHHVRCQGFTLCYRVPDTGRCWRKAYMCYAMGKETSISLFSRDVPRLHTPVIRQSAFFGQLWSACVTVP